MKKFDKIFIWITFLFSGMLILINVFFPENMTNSTGMFNIETNRILQELSDEHEINIDDYQTISGVDECFGDNFYSSENPCVFREIQGKLYRIEYREITQKNSRILQFVNLVIILLFLILLLVLLYIRQTMIKPFHEISELPYRLAKGNLTAPLKETKSRYFGKFIWGLDMLREELENSRHREFERAKREKTAILSISHDIKTPLSAIKLYAKAIANNLYADTEKQRISAENINAKANQIEQYVNELTSKLSDDFMEFHLQQKEEYISTVIHKINAYYSDKLNISGTNFFIKHYTDCLISCDPERLEEVLQNIMENAIKYGDGKSIFIAISDEEDCKLMTISNSGNTLPDTEISHIFDSFWRGSNAGKISGNGLGLYICRRLMNAMHGDIYAEIQENMFCITIVCRKII